MIKYVVFILLLASVVSGESFDLGVDENISFKGKEIILESVGSEGSAVLRIDNVVKKISLGKSVDVYGLRIKVVDSFYGINMKERFVKLEIEQVGCILNDDCDDNNPCSADVCVANECRYVFSSGCVLNKECVKEGTINVFRYCKNGFWMKQKKINDRCERDYECLSGRCEEVCVKEEENKNYYVFALLIALLIVIFCLKRFIKLFVF